LQTGYRLLKTDFKPVIGFTDLHKNIALCKANYIITLYLTHRNVRTRI